MAQFTYQVQNRTATITAFGPVAESLRAQPGEYAEVLTEDDVEALKGPELDEALDARKLPRSGKVADKRQRLLEATANPVDDPESQLEVEPATPVPDESHVPPNAATRPTPEES
jgi:hypothetical protein